MAKAALGQELRLAAPTACAWLGFSRQIFVETKMVRLLRKSYFLLARTIYKIVSKLLKKVSSYWWARLEVLRIVIRIGVVLDAQSIKTPNIVFSEEAKLLSLQIFFDNFERDRSQLARLSVLRCFALFRCCPIVPLDQRQNICKKIIGIAEKSSKYCLDDSDNDRFNRAMLSVCHCEAQVVLFEVSLDEQSLTILQKNKVLSLVKNCDQIISFFEKTDTYKMPGNILSLDFAKLRIYWVRARAYLVLSSTQGDIGFVTHTQSAIDSFNAMSPSKPTMLTKGFGISPKFHSLKLRVKLGIKAKDINELKDACLALKKMLPILEKYPQTKTDCLVGIVQASTEIFTLDSKQGFFKDQAIANSKRALSTSGIQVGAACLLIENLVKLHIQSQNWQKAADAASSLLVMQKNHIKNIRSRGDIRDYASKIKDMGDLAAFCYCRLNEPLQAMQAVERSRSIYWKHSAARKSFGASFSDKFDPKKTIINSASQNRTNVIISICEYGICWMILCEINGEYTVSCRVHDRTNSRDIHDHVFTDGKDSPMFSQLSESSLTSIGPDFQMAAMKWNTAVSRTLEWLWENIIKEIHKSLLQQKIVGHSHVHLIPSGLHLGLLPIQSAGIRSTSGEWTCFSDYWSVSVSDSLLHEHYSGQELLGLDDMQSQKENVGITDPTMDLGISSNPAALSDDFIDIVGENATREKVLQALQTCTTISFFCHARCELFSPATSYFLLSNNERLTLGDIGGLSLKNSPTVLLGSCESGLYELFQYNESQGLSAGLLWAGASAVAGTYWPVTINTAGLVVRELSKEIQCGKPLPQALSTLQKKMRDGEITLSDTSSHGTGIPLSGVLADLSQPIHWAVYGIHMR